MSESLTEDNGIIKIRLTEMLDAQDVPWRRGFKAKFNYTAHAYIIPTKSHKHDAACACNSTESLQTKVEMINNLMNRGRSGSKEAIVDLDTDDKDVEQQPVRTLISDSKINDSLPFELRIGYSFSVVAIELCIKSMKPGERARFLCQPNYCDGFVQLESLMRQERFNRERVADGRSPINTSGCSAHMTQEVLDLSKGLDDAVGAPIEFEFELLEVMQPESFLREPWELTSNEKYSEVIVRKAEGALIYGKKDWMGASDKYERCLVLLEALSTSAVVLDMKKEKKDIQRGIHSKSIISSDNIVDLEKVDELTRICRLNYAACKLKNKDYLTVIQQCSEVLRTDPKNIKGLFRRGQAYTGLGRDLDFASRDFDAIEVIVLPDSTEFQELRVQRKVLYLKIKSHEEKERALYGGKLV